MNQSAFNYCYGILEDHVASKHTQSRPHWEALGFGTRKIVNQIYVRHLTFLDSRLCEHRMHLSAMMRLMVKQGQQYIFRVFLADFSRHSGIPYRSFEIVLTQSLDVFSQFSVNFYPGIDQ